MPEEEFWDSLTPLKRDVGQQALGPLLMLALKSNLENIQDDTQLQTTIMDKAVPPEGRWEWSRAGVSLAQMGVSIAETIPLQMKDGFFTEAQQRWLGRKNTYTGSDIEEFEKRQLTSAFSTPPFMMQFISQLERTAPREHEPGKNILGFHSQELAAAVEKPWLASMVTKAAFAPSGFWGIRDTVYMPDVAINVHTAANLAAKRDKWPPQCWKPIEPAEKGEGFQLTHAALGYVAKLVTERNATLRKHEGFVSENTLHHRRTSIGCPVGVPFVKPELAEAAYTPRQLQLLADGGILLEKRSRLNVDYDPFKAVCQTSTFLIRHAAAQRS